MSRADKAVLRLAVGMGLAALIAYGLGLPEAFVVCILTVMLLCKPGPPIPFAKGVVAAFVIVGLLVGGGMLLAPILRHYPLTGILLTGALLYTVFFAGARSASPLTIFLVIACTVIPVAGLYSQPLATALSQAIGIGLAIGVFVIAVSHAFFPDTSGRANVPAPPTAASPEAARWAALQATLVVMPVLVLALTNPSFYVSAIMRTVMLGQQSTSTNARSAGLELVGSTVMGAVLAAVVWFGLTLRPNLWMLMLWLMATALWAGPRIFRLRPTALPPSFWSYSLVTMLILLGPAIQDAAVGKDVYRASAVRVSLFVAVSLYAWAMVWALERWRGSRAPTPA